MYHTHVKEIREAFDRYPADTVEAVVRFTLATIQQRFHTVPSILNDWSVNGVKASSCWGSKKAGVKFIRKHAAEIAAQLQDATVVEVIDVLLTIPGLNTVKAAFVAQLLGFEVGCIDSQNAKMYGINVNAFKITPKHTAKTRLAKIRAYVTLCNELGGSAHLWDQWCHLIATNQAAHFEDAEQVSDMHVDCILRDH